MNRIPYKEALICPAPKRVFNGAEKKWNGDFTLEYHEDPQVRVSFHGTGKIYPTEDAAQREILTLAKPIIDGH